LFLFGLLSVWLGLGYRLFEVQVVRADEYREMGLNQRLTREVLAPDRGTIFDRDGNPLAMTIDSQTLYAMSDEVEDPTFVAQQVAAVTGRDWRVLRERLIQGDGFVYLARQVEPEAAAKVLELDLAGVYSLEEPKRVYPQGAVASHVVGLVDVDGKGLEGLEYQYDEILSGTPGEVVFERDRRGIPIPQGLRHVIPPVPGDDLVTSVNLTIQYAAYQACEEVREETDARACWVVALHAETGEVLAMAGAPGFDPERRMAEDGSTHLTNFVVRGMYEPGSTQKLITLAAALDTGTVGVDTVIPQVSDRIEINPGACRSPDDDIFGCFGDFSPHETVDMTVGDIFTRSSNVGTIKIAQRLPAGALVDYMERFGLGHPTGIDYSGEAPGLLDRPRDPHCNTCVPSAAIGYAVAVTPLQMAAAYAAIANDGVWTSPSLVSSRIGIDGEISSFQPQTRRVVEPETAWVMRQLLAMVVSEGTGQLASIPGYRVGGKTGTANKLGDDGKYTDETVASFVGMAPIDDPKVVVAVVVDQPAYEYRTGGRAAAPVFADVMEAALHALGVVPDAVSS
jgi:cell division protein FtsI/penicillin-binding protein 2